MYKNLKFSWAHILAFLALICIGYISFVGLTYDIDEGFKKPAFIMLGILLILIIWFIGVQQLKGIDNNFSFSKCIWWERILLFTSPIVFVLCMYPFNHAINVSSEAKNIETTFVEAIASSTKMFDDYERYSQERIKNYKDFLLRVKTNKNIQPSLYQELGFNGKDDDKKIQIEIETLDRQLTANYDSLNIVAREWIKRVDQKTSVWNVFLVGNIKEIQSAIQDWSTSLKSFSSVILSTEKLQTHEVRPFDTDEEHIGNIINKLNSLTQIYNPSNESNKLNYKTVLWGIILYILLIFPYLIQVRNGVSTYTLFGRRFMKQGIDMSVPISDQTIKKNASTIKIERTKINSEANVINLAETHSIKDEKEYEIKENNDDSDILTKEERRRRRQERRLAREKNNQEYQE